jgi:DNA-binding NtrC family response regulator
VKKPENEPATLGTARLARSIRAGDALSLRVIDGTLVTSQSLPKQGTVVLGRSRDADVMIGSTSLSRKHAALHLGPSMRVEDLGSANGTLVGGRAIPPRSPVELRVGEPVQLGSVIVIVQYEDGASAPTSALTSGGEAREGRPAIALSPATQRIASSGISVLILGETGVGKEVMAETIHLRSPRAPNALVRLNCAAFAEHLLESELFGHEKGAFTGADQSKPGLLEVAGGGTVFLDEVGELPLALQSKLLRVFEQREVMRVGAVRARPIDVRFLAATNRDLEAEVASGRFRRDLLFRLNGFSLVIPPLRERRAEITPLARAFVEEAARRSGRGPAPLLSEDAIALLEAHPWPGNIRELRNVIERAVVLCVGDVLEREHLILDSAGGARLALTPAATGPQGGDRPDPAAALRAELEALERQRIVDALNRAGGNQSAAAKELGMSRGTFLTRLDAFGIPRPRKRS